MPDATRQPAPAWGDEFTRPDLERLIAGVEEKDRAAFRGVLEALLQRKGCRERIEWLGLPWRWTISVFRSQTEHPALAYLVPRPVGALVCIPTPMLDHADPITPALTKPVRVALDRAPIIAGFVWPEWPVAELDLVAVQPLLEARERGGGA